LWIEETPTSTVRRSSSSSGLLKSSVYITIVDRGDSVLGSGNECAASVVDGKCHDVVTLLWWVKRKKWVADVLRESSSARPI